MYILDQNKSYGFQYTISLISAVVLQSLACHPFVQQFSLVPFNDGQACFLLVVQIKKERYTKLQAMQKDMLRSLETSEWWKISTLEGLIKKIGLTHYHFTEAPYTILRKFFRILRNLDFFLLSSSNHVDAVGKHHYSTDYMRWCHFRFCIFLTGKILPSLIVQCKQNPNLACNIYFKTVLAFFLYSA